MVYYIIIYSLTLKIAYMIFKQNEHSQVNPSDAIPSKNVLLQTYLYVCNALHNRRLTLIAIIKLIIVARRK